MCLYGNNCRQYDPKCDKIIYDEGPPCFKTKSKPETREAQRVVSNDLLSAQGYLLGEIYKRAKYGRRRARGHNCEGTAACQSIIDMIDNWLGEGR